MRAFAVLLFLVVPASAIYVFQGNPYLEKGVFPEKDIVTINLWKNEGGKYHSVAYVPNIAGTYGVLYFIGGLGGIIPAEFYSETLKKIAGHGYVVIGVDHIAGGVFPPGAEEELKWLKANLQNYINHHTKGGVLISWEHLGLAGHSAGAQSVLEMLYQNPKVANCTLFLEGGWVNNPPLVVNFTHPSLIYATEYATRHSLMLPECGTKGQAEQLGLIGDVLEF